MNGTDGGDPLVLGIHEERSKDQTRRVGEGAESGVEREEMGDSCEAAKGGPNKYVGTYSSVEYDCWLLLLPKVVLRYWIVAED